MPQSFSHEITKSEIEMMEIDEKLPIKKLEQIESSRIRTLINENFPFHFLMEIEKFYQELSKDLKINKNKNLDYKIKIAAGYLSILKNDENWAENINRYYSNNSSKGLTGGAIAGIIIACLAAVAIVAALIVLIKKGVFASKKAIPELHQSSNSSVDMNLKIDANNI